MTSNQETAIRRAPPERLAGENETIAEGRRWGLLTGEPRLEWVLHLARRVARTELPVLLEGETGTGKELLARFIHGNSARDDMPFVSQNCAAIPTSLLESELFGYQRGAFTNATRDRRGVFDIADGGTVFLDEVGEIPLEAQPKLLRVLQEGQVWPLGSEKPHRVNVRVIAATNRELEGDAGAGRFRRDLYYRLSVFPIALPPLRSRRSDIPMLVEHFASQYATRCGKPNPAVSEDVVTLLLSYAFPGNIRELENLVARAVVLMEDSSALLPAHFPSLAANHAPSGLREEVRRFKTDLILGAVRTEGSVAAAARRLGMTPRNLYKLSRRLGLVLEPGRPIGSKQVA